MYEIERCLFACRSPISRAPIPQIFVVSASLSTRPRHRQSFLPMCASRTPAGSGGLAKGIAFAALRSIAAIAVPHAPDNNRLVAIRPAGKGVEIELTSSRLFPIGDALPVLTMGDHSYRLSRFPKGRSDRIVFVLNAAEYAAAAEGAPVTLRIGGADPWVFGTLRK